MREYVVRWALTLTTIGAWAALDIMVLHTPSPLTAVISGVLGIICWLLFDPFMQRKERLW